MATSDFEPENWLTYNGDHRESVGILMGPGWGVGYSTVVAADYDPAAGERGQTRLGMVSGDVRDELQAAG